MMGRDLTEVAEAAGHEVWPTDVERLARDPEDRIDVTSVEALSQAVRTYEPGIIFHLAALTDVDGCETNPDAAYRVNTLGTENVALVCREYGLRLLYVSTGSVFDGLKPTPYHEFDDPRPKSVYSRSKWMGELAVRQLVPEHFIVRAGWMFGGGPEDKKFVAKIIELARERDQIRAVDDKIGSPTYTRDISEFCLDVVRQDRFGTFHGSNPGHCTRFEMAQAILEFAGIDNCTVEPCSSAEFPLAAPRPRLEAMECMRSRLAGLATPRPWRDALRAYIEETLL
jgi:dTDP-4-dehydrorhamnose reductase